MLRPLKSLKSLEDDLIFAKRSYKKQIDDAIDELEDIIRETILMALDANHSKEDIIKILQTGLLHGPNGESFLKRALRNLDRVMKVKGW